MSEEKKAETTSLTKVLRGLDGEVLRISRGLKDVVDMSIREAVKFCLLQGPDALRVNGKPPLSDEEKFKCFMLAREIENTEATGFTFKSEQVTLIKKLAASALPTEPYGVLVLELDPGEEKGKD